MEAHKAEMFARVHAEEQAPTEARERALLHSSSHPDAITREQYDTLSEEWRPGRREWMYLAFVSRNLRVIMKPLLPDDEQRKVLNDLYPIVAAYLPSPEVQVAGLTPEDIELLLKRSGRIQQVALDKRLERLVQKHTGANRDGGVSNSRESDESRSSALSPRGDRVEHYRPHQFQGASASDSSHHLLPSSTPRTPSTGGLYDSDGSSMFSTGSASVSASARDDGDDDDDNGDGSDYEGNYDDDGDDDDDDDYDDGEGVDEDSDQYDEEHGGESDDDDGEVLPNVEVDLEALSNGDVELMMETNDGDDGNGEGDNAAATAKARPKFDLALDLALKISAQELETPSTQEKKKKKKKAMKKKATKKKTMKNSGIASSPLKKTASKKSSKVKERGTTPDGTEAVKKTPSTGKGAQTTPKTTTKVKRKKKKTTNASNSSPSSTTSSSSKPDSTPRAKGKTKSSQMMPGSLSRSVSAGKPPRVPGRPSSARDDSKVGGMSRSARMAASRKRSASSKKLLQHAHSSREGMSTHTLPTGFDMDAERAKHGRAARATEEERNQAHARWLASLKARKKKSRSMSSLIPAASNSSPRTLTPAQQQALDAKKRVVEEQKRILKEATARRKRKEKRQRELEELLQSLLHMPCVYTSEVSGNRKCVGDTRKMKWLLEAHKITYRVVDVSLDHEERDYMIQVSGSTQLPQMFVNDTYRGHWEDVMQANEEDRLRELLDPDELPPELEARQQAYRSSADDADGSIAGINDEISALSQKYRMTLKTEAMMRARVAREKEEAEKARLEKEKRRRARMARKPPEDPRMGYKPTKEEMDQQAALLAHTTSDPAYAGARRRRNSMPAIPFLGMQVHQNSQS